MSAQGRAGEAAGGLARELEGWFQRSRLEANAGVRAGTPNSLVMPLMLTLGESLPRAGVPGS